MSSIDYSNIPAARSHLDRGRPALSGLRRLSAGLWAALTRIGERRAAADIARHVQLRGGTPTGDVRRDIQQIIAARHLR